MHVTDSDDTMNPATDGAAAFIQLSLDEFSSLKTLASETLKHPPHKTNKYTACNGPKAANRADPDIYPPLIAECTNHFN